MRCAIEPCSAGNDTACGGLGDVPETGPLQAERTRGVDTLRVKLAQLRKLRGGARNPQASVLSLTIPSGANTYTHFTRNPSLFNAASTSFFWIQKGKGKKKDKISMVRLSQICTALKRATYPMGQQRVRSGCHPWQQPPNHSQVLVAFGSKCICSLFLQKGGG